MDPVTAGLIITTAATAASGAAQSREVTRQGRFERDIQNYNAALDKIAAREAGRKAALQARQHRRATSKRQAANRAALAKSGIALEGSPLLVQQQNKANADFDEFLIRRQGQIEEAQLTSASQLSLVKGTFARESARSKKRTILLSTASSVTGTLNKLRT